MKYSTTTVAILLAVASAQSLGDIPQCAQPCIITAVQTSTSCDLTNYVCICQNKDKVVQGATTCVINACGIDVATGMSRCSPMPSHCFTG